MAFGESVIRRDRIGRFGGKFCRPFSGGRMAASEVIAHERPAFLFLHHSDMTQTRHPDGSDLDNRHRFGARARHAGDSPTAVCTADIRALARSLRSGLQARVYQAWICYRKASARGSSEIAARSPGMVVVGTVVASTRGRAFPVIYIQRRRSGMLLFTLQSPR